MFSLSLDFSDSDVATKPETYKRTLERDGTPIDEAHAYDETQKLFFQIPDTMLKCAGLIKTNEEEYDTCIDALFKFMILGRATKIIDGQCARDMLAKWENKLGGAHEFMETHCYTMGESL